MQHPDEGTIHAWLDGALSTEGGAAVEAHVATCPECAAAVAEARGLIAASSRIVSALDIAPGGVIPLQDARVRRPAWYSTTQFRAAAAVLVVAGASMLLVQGRDGESVEKLSQQVMSTLSAETPQSLPETADVAANAAPAMQVLPAVPLPATRALEGGAAGATVPMREKLAVAGATAESDAAGLTVVSSDSTADARTTIFMVEQGATVTLTETSALQPVRAMARERQLSARAADASAADAGAAAPPPAPVNQRFPVLSISWTDSVTNRNVTLTGPFSRERLEELRRQIEARGLKD